MRSRPSCLFFAYDPQAPLRDPLTRRDPVACLADMTACMAEICANHGQNIVTEADLERVGFTPDEIERHRGDAVAALAERLKPRDVAASPASGNATA